MSPLTLTLIQTDLIWENKQANLQMLEKKIREISVPTQIVVLPEMFSTGFTMNAEQFAEDMQGPSLVWMKKMAAEKKVILTGSLIIKAQSAEEPSKTCYYNRLVWMLPDGSYGFYDKRHLFAYSGENLQFESGHRRLIASVNGWKILLLVCYDLRFPVWSRQHITGGNAARDAAPEYDLAIYVASWPEKRNHAWKTLLQARAIENQCYVVGVNRVGKDGHDIYYGGDSMVVDPLGTVVYQKSHEEEVHTTTLALDFLKEVRMKYPFWKDADAYTINQ